MHVLILGGAGFVGLNIASACLEAGHRVTLFDQAPPPSTFTHTVDVVKGDVRDATALAAVFEGPVDAVVLGAAVTAGPAREAADPDTILSVNLGALPGILNACRLGGVRRVINLSSAAAYGPANAAPKGLTEDVPAVPESLYAISKLASEGIGRRLAAHWGLDFVSVRLSAVFGRWERDTGVRDTLSPQAQILQAAAAGTPALLLRSGERDWVYATDVAEAILKIIEIGTALAPLYNITSGRRWSALAWGEAFAANVPGFVCRLARPGEKPTIDLHSSNDRPSLSGELFRRDLGWCSRFDLQASVHDLARWWQQQAERSS